MPMDDEQSTTTEWWREAVVYQIYVRSFADGNADGTGDIAGMQSRLGYLRDLGVDAVWINPWYRSPLRDGGYDVADYREINDAFGTTTEAEAFIAAAADHGIRVIVDLVPNHTSSDHAWFVEALASPPGADARARYHFVDGRGPEGSEPPNDWQSVFGGPAWTRVPDGQWYLHLFDESQPDVNWNHADVGDEFDAVMRFWLDRGAAGFRMDVAHALTKAPGYPDAGLDVNDGKATTDAVPYLDRDDLHPIVRRWRRVLDEYDGRMMVAEAWVAAERRPLYLRSDEYHQAFDFDLLSAPWDAKQFTTIIDDSLRAANAVGSNSTWVLSNHDVVRQATRYGLPAGVEPGLWLLDGPRRPARRGTWSASGACGGAAHARTSWLGVRVPGRRTRLARGVATCRSTCCRIRSGTTPVTRSRVVTGAVCRFRGSRPARRSGSARWAAGCRSRRSTPGSPRASRSTIPNRHCSSTVRRWRSVGLGGWAMTRPPPDRTDSSPGSTSAPTWSASNGPTACAASSTWATSDHVARSATSCSPPRPIDGDRLPPDVAVWIA